MSSDALSASSRASQNPESVPFALHNEMMQRMQARVEELQHQLDWFRRQAFGPKSERRVVLDGAQDQLPLTEQTQPSEAPSVVRTVAAHTRTQPQSKPEPEEARLSFDPSKVPLERIELANPEVGGLSPDQYEVIGEKRSHRLA